MNPIEIWDGVDIPALLELESLGNGRFISQRHDLNQQQRIFGGQLLAQAASAAARQVDQGRAPTYLHGLFLKGAVAGQPIEYAVESLQEGKRFSSFRVRGIQAGNAVIDAHVSFKVDEQGIEHSDRLSESVPPPEACLTMGMLEQKYAERLSALNYRLLEKSTLEARFLDPEDFLFKAAERPKVGFWIRARRAPAAGLQQALATIYMSDYFVGFCTMAAHRPMVGARNDIYVASLNHSIWLHEPTLQDEWLLFMTESPHAKSGRGLADCRIFGQDGRLVATVVQEMSVVEKAG